MAPASAEKLGSERLLLLSAVLYLEYILKKRYNIKKERKSSRYLKIQFYGAVV